MLLQKIIVFTTKMIDQIAEMLRYVLASLRASVIRRN